MNTLGLPTIKYTSQLQIGELCWIETGSERNLAICAQAQPEGVVLGLMPQDLSAWKLTVIPTSRKSCASFGEDWVLEAGAPASWVFSRGAASEEPGGAFVSETGPILLFRSPEWNDAAYFHLVEKQRDDYLPGTSIRMNSFRIWASPEGRSRPGAAPIFEI